MKMLIGYVLDLIFLAGWSGFYLVQYLLFYRGLTEGYIFPAMGYLLMINILFVLGSIYWVYKTLILFLNNASIRVRFKVLLISILWSVVWIFLHIFYLEQLVKF